RSLAGRLPANHRPPLPAGAVHGRDRRHDGPLGQRGSEAVCPRRGTIATRNGNAPVNTPENDHLEDELASLLLAYDDALLGRNDSCPDADDAPAKLRLRTVQACACIRLLRRRWPPSSEVGGMLPPDPARDFKFFAGQTKPQIGRFLIRRELGRGGFGIV